MTLAPGTRVVAHMNHDWPDSAPGVVVGPAGVPTHTLIRLDTPVTLRAHHPCTPRTYELPEVRVRNEYLSLA